MYNKHVALHPDRTRPARPRVVAPAPSPAAPAGLVPGRLEFPNLASGSAHDEAS
jgi:hypothetical protein